jgi:hypothetical protein
MTEEIEGFLDAAKDMRRRAGSKTYRLDTSNLSISEVVDRIERWIVEERQRTAAR